MADVSLQEIHEDLEVIKRDVLQLKEALLGEEGELSDWARERLGKYAANGPKKLTPHDELERTFR